MNTETYNLADLAHTLFEENGDALFLFDPDSEQMIDVNPMAQRLTGCTRSALLRMSVSSLFRSETSGGMQRLRAASRRSGLFHSQEGYFLRHEKDAAWVPVNLTVTRLHVEPRALGLITARDVSERRETHAVLRKTEAELLDALRSNEARYRSLIENLEQCIFLKDAEYRFVAVNAPFCRAVGRDEAEVLGRTDFDFYPRDLAEKYRNDDRQILTEGRRVEVEETSVLEGQRRTVRVVKTPVRDGQGRISGVLGIFWDVTEQRTLEDQLRQAQKMEAVGQLAGGVAHDFNNLLTAILGNLSMLSNTLLLDGPAREMLQTAESAALRAANLTRQLLGFARRTLLRPEAASLNVLIDEVVSLLKRTIDPRITLEARMAPALWPVLADSGHINQVLMNLCLNARDAMPEGGRILLETENALLAPEKVRLRAEARSGEFVCLRVSDTGTGMTEEVRQHIFEPFFTTKGPGKGTGLGLATVFGIVKQHQGWIDCDSEPGRGTTFHIYLPRLARSGEAGGDPSAAPSDHGEPEGTETVLFVDDEAILRNLGRTILERVGYQVLLAEDGVHALEVYQRERERIDLVVLDLTMPRLSGKDTFRALRAIDPTVKVLFASGYSPEQLSGEEQEQLVGFVPKPYRPRELARVVRRTLDGVST